MRVYHTFGLLAVVLLPVWGHAAVINVPGDTPTVRGAIRAAVSGDSVFIERGVYWEPSGTPAFVKSGVTILAEPWNESILESTVLAGIELFLEAGLDPIVIENLWIYDRRISCDNSQGLVLRCRFGDENGALEDGRLAYLRGGGVFRECFIRGSPTLPPYSYFEITGGTVVVESCVMALRDGQQLFNVEDIGPFALESVRVANNTIYGAGFWMSFNAAGVPIEIENNIISSLGGGSSMSCFAGEIVFSHNDLFGDFGTTCSIDETNISDDPLLCNPELIPEDPSGFELDAESPCIGAGVDGSTIGALGVGCGVTSVIDHHGHAVAPVRLTVRPNPSFGRVHFLLNGSLNQAVNLKIYDVAGRLVDTLPGVDRLTEWSARGVVGPGVYFVTGDAEGLERSAVRFTIVR